MVITVGSHNLFEFCGRFSDLSPFGLFFLPLVSFFLIFLVWKDGAQ